jgi:hypothetical protein
MDVRVIKAHLHDPVSKSFSGKSFRRMGNWPNQAHNNVRGLQERCL